MQTHSFHLKYNRQFRQSCIKMIPLALATLQRPEGSRAVTYVGNSYCQLFGISNQFQHSTVKLLIEDWSSSLGLRQPLNARPKSCLLAFFLVYMSIVASASIPTDSDGSKVHKGSIEILQALSPAFKINSKGSDLHYSSPMRWLSLEGRIRENIIFGLHYQ